MNRAACLLSVSLWMVLSLASCSQPDPLLSLPPRPEVSDYEEAVRRQFEERYAAVERILASSERSDSALALAYGALGMVFQAYQDHEPAGVCYQNAHVLDPGEFRWAYYLGIAQQSLGSYAASDQALVKALELRPGDLPALVALGENALARNDPDQATARFQEALATNPANVQALYGLGRSFIELGDSQRALPHLEAAHAKQPQATSLLYTLGVAHRSSGNLEQAQAFFDRVPRSHLTNHELIVDDPLMREVGALRRGAMAHEHRGLKAAAQGNYSLAAAELREAVALDGDRLEARHNLALSLLGLGRHEEAQAEVEEILKRAPDFAPTHVLHARILLDEGRMEEAEAGLRRAIEADPALANAHLVLAEVLAATGREDEALRSRQRALQLKPEE